MQQTYSKAELVQIYNAANQGNADAMMQLADIFQNGIEGIRPNEEQARVWLRRAAEQGSTEAKLRRVNQWIDNGLQKGYLFGSKHRIKLISDTVYPIFKETPGTSFMSQPRDVEEIPRWLSEFVFCTGLRRYCRVENEWDENTNLFTTVLFSDAAVYVANYDLREYANPVRIVFYDEISYVEYLNEKDLVFHLHNGNKLSCKTEHLSAAFVSRCINEVLAAFHSWDFQLLPDELQVARQFGQDRLIAQKKQEGRTFPDPSTLPPKPRNDILKEMGEFTNLVVATSLTLGLEYASSRNYQIDGARVEYIDSHNGIVVDEYGQMYRKKDNTENEYYSV